MTNTLNFLDHLLSLGRKYQELGRLTDAEDVLGKLAGFRELPADAAEEAQARLAELHLRRRKYGRARRCLTAALANRPDSARYHLLMAAALQADDRGDLQRADVHYRRSLELDPQQVKCRSDSGLLAVRLGEPRKGCRDCARPWKRRRPTWRRCGSWSRGCGWPTAATTPAPPSGPGCSATPAAPASAASGRTISSKRSAASSSPAGA